MAGVGILDDEGSSTVLVRGWARWGASPADALCLVGRAAGRTICLPLADMRDGVPTLGGGPQQV